MVRTNTTPRPQPLTEPPRPARRGDRGLTTLEWLLIVAAVAGLAALAVVLVQNVVDDTAEQIAGNSARGTAAQVAAAEITEDSKTFTTADPFKDRVATQKKRCERLGITYGDVLDESTTPNPKWTVTGTAGEAKCEVKLKKA